MRPRFTTYPIAFNVQVPSASVKGLPSKFNIEYVERYLFGFLHARLSRLYGLLHRPDARSRGWMDGWVVASIFHKMKKGDDLKNKR